MKKSSILYTRFSYFLLSILVFFSCNDREIDCQFNFEKLQSHFNPNTQYSSIVFLPGEMRVTVLENKKENLIAEWRSNNNENWKIYRKYEAIADGDTNLEDYLFVINKDLQNFCVSKSDSISLNSKVSKLVLSTPRTYFNEKNIVLNILSFRNNEQQKSEFIYLEK